MSWYSNYSPETKALDAVIDKHPPLSQLIMCPQFLPQLKLFNPKLLDYLTNSPSLAKQMVTYLVVSPREDDHPDRKFKLPLLSIQMVETQTTCIVNSFFKPCFLEKQQQQVPAIVAMFYYGLAEKQILPISAGYFQRAILVLYRTRLKQLLDVLYIHRKTFDLLINHSYNTAITSILNILLNIENTKMPPSNDDRTSMKLGTVRKILEKMDIEYRKNCNLPAASNNSILLFENISCVLREIVQRYCLIADGKLMLEIILEEKHVNMVMDAISKQSQFSISAMDLALTIIKYYSLSAFNSDQGTEQLAKKNMQRLQSQYFIVKMNQTFQILLVKIKNCSRITYYYYKLLEVLCHCITLSSRKMLHKIKQVQLYPTLIQLLFKHEHCNILHKLIQRAFLHIFVTNKAIYQFYKKYLFCQISIIDLTVNKILLLFPQNNCLTRAMRKPYFGIFMKIIKIYSGIQTLDPQIRTAITSKAEVWNKMSKKFIKPYQILTKDQLGAMNPITNTLNQQRPIEFTVNKINYNHNPIFLNSNNRTLINLAIQEVQKQEETMPKTLEATSNEATTFSSTKDQLGSADSGNKSNSNEKQEEDGFFKVPDQIHQEPKQGDKTKKQNQLDSKNNSFTDFMSQKMAEADKEIRMQRSMSGQKRLSAGKRTRMASPSPNRKRNSWKEDQNQNADDKKTDNKTDNQPKRERKAFTNQDHPKIPTPSIQGNSSMVSSKSENHLSKSAVGPSVSNKAEQFTDGKHLSLSLANMQSLKKTKIVRIDVKPEQKKKYRKIQDKDKPLLMYLGIKC